MTLTLRFVVTVLVTVVGASFQFYSFAVLNTTQDVVEGWINDTYRSRGTFLSPGDLTLLWSFIVSILPIGGLIGSSVTKLLAENCGRRSGLVLNGLLNVIGGFMELNARSWTSPEILLLGRLILGINIGLSCGLAPMYLTEIAPVRWRGAVGTTHQIAASFGDWFCMFVSLPFILGGTLNWPLALAFPAAPALLLCIVLPFCPESPRYLLLKLGDRERARKAIESLVGKSTEAMFMMEDLENEALNLKVYSNKSCSEWAYKPELYKPLLITILIMVAQQFTGIAAVLGYSSEMFVSANLSLEFAQIATVGVGACYFLCTIPSVYLIEFLGRRSLVLFQQIGCTICLIFLSIFIGLDQYWGLKWASFGSVAVLAIFMCVYGVGSPVPWLIASELFSQEYRSTAVSAGTFTSFIMAFVVSTFYLPLQDSVGASFSFLPFIVVSIGCSICIFFFLPETKNRRIDQIVEDFRESLPVHGLVHSKSCYAKIPFEDNHTNQKLNDGRKGSSGYGSFE